MYLIVDSHTTHLNFPVDPHTTENVDVPEEIGRRWVAQTATGLAAGAVGAAAGVTAAHFTGSQKSSPAWIKRHPKYTKTLGGILGFVAARKLTPYPYADCGAQCGDCLNCQYRRPGAEDSLFYWL